MTGLNDKSSYTITDSNGILICTAYNQVSVAECREALNMMKQKALEKNITKIMVDVLTVDFRNLTLIERHDIGKAAAEILRADFKLACVIQKQFINKHTENVANNRGANIRIFDNLGEAKEWLLK